MKNVCPRCGQPLEERFGVPLSALRRRIISIIEERPGITSARMVAMLYPGKDLKSGRRALFANLVHLNSALEETDVRIVKLNGGYQLMKTIKGGDHD